MCSIARMRLALCVLAAVTIAFVAATGCKGNTCTSSTPQPVTFDTSTLAPSSAVPLCSKCGGPVENPYYECQSTCAPLDAGEDVNLDEDAEAGTVVTGAASTCYVDSCLQAVQAAQGNCSSLCATLYPTDDVVDCESEGGTVVSCTVTEPDVCK